MADGLPPAIVPHLTGRDARAGIAAGLVLRFAKRAGTSPENGAPAE